MDTKNDSSNLRTEEEREKARHELCDAFYPRKNGWNCDVCGDAEYHKTECDFARVSQGWQSMVCSTKETEGVCHKSGCNKDATVRVRLNIWGSLCELDLCDDHGKRSDGSLRDLVRCDSV